MSRLVRLFEIDLRSLAAMRIGVAITALYCLFVLAPDLGPFFTADGLTPADRSAPHFRWGGFTPLVWLTSYPAVLAVWAAGVLAGLALLVGFHGRWAAFALWLVWMSLAQRNGFITQGGDRLLILLLFWSIFLPVSARFSIDHALTPEAEKGPGAVVSVATVGLLFQVLHVYVFGALLKTSEAWAPNGAAVYVALHLDTFVTDFGVWVRQFGAILQILTLFVFCIELFAPALLFFPDRRLVVRRVTLALLICMHVGFRVFLHIGHFWMVSLASLMAYAPGGWWDWIARRRGGAGRIEIWYDRDCGFCRKTALILKEFFLTADVPVRPAQDHPEIGPLLEREVSWVVVDATGRRRLHWDAVAYVTRQNPLLAPIGWLAWGFGAVGLGRPAYDLIGRRRKALGRVTRWLRPPRRLVPRVGPAVSVFLGVVIVFGLLWNLRPHVGDLIPGRIAAAASAAGLTQDWTMFAPAPPAEDGVPVVTVRPAADPSAALNLYPRPPVAADADLRAYDHFPSYRWRKYLNNLRFLRQVDDPHFEDYMRLYAAHACAVAERATGARPAAINVTLRMNRTLSNYGSEDFTDDWGDWPCPPR